MKICRFNHDRVGVVHQDRVFDITSLFNLSLTWPHPPGDLIASQLPALLPEIREAFTSHPSYAVEDVHLNSPIANPGKIVGAPINYKAHIEEANADKEINAGKTYTSIDQFGLFLKAGSSAIGVDDVILKRFPDRRTDHEIELAVVIGKEASCVKREEALDYVLGYMSGLDMTIRGSEFPTFRKSVDTYTVLGPWLVTTDEIENPNCLRMSLDVNGELKQDANTNLLIFDVERLIEYASSFYTLYPGDIIMTGTPAGVGPVEVGDVISAEVEHLGRMTVKVAAWS